MTNFTELTEHPGYFIAHSPPRLKRVINGIEHVCTQTPSSKKDNYWSVTVKTRENKFVKRNMHRLLMQTFVPNPLNKAHVNHIDGNKSNNDLTNLEWATEKENAQHAIQTGLTDTAKTAKTVYQYLLNGTFVAEFKSDTAAEAATGIPKQNISKTTLGLRAHAGYFQWRRYFQLTIPAVQTKYIKGYIYESLFFSTVAELAVHLGRTKNLTTITLSCFKKSVRNNTQIVFYD